MKMFIQICLALILSILLCFNRYSQASNFDSEGKYERLLEPNEKYHKAPKYGKYILSSTFNVRDFGAKGDKTTDDTKAFMKAWASTCKAKNAVMLVPAGFVFLLQPITFDGNGCQSNPTFQVEGKLIAPNKSNWQNISEQWIMFRGFSNGLKITGNGVFSGSGNDWWTQSILFNEKRQKKNNNAPHALMIENSKRVFVEKIKIENSPRMHIFFSNCQQVSIINLSLNSPENSPNTDGIHLTHTQHVEINDSTLSCGDDCVSIQTGCSNVTISNVHCGPGHGYSIGSLGYNGQQAFVSDISIYNSKVVGTPTGLRIKTWENATGSVQNVKYENIQTLNVKIPIIIDEHYCDGSDFCHQSKLNGGGVAISGIKYKNITGTYTDQAVAFVCSTYKPCRDIIVSDVDLKPTGGAVAERIKCSNAHGKVISTPDPLWEKCLQSD